MPVIHAVTLILILSSVLVFLRTRYSKSWKLPPGPRGVPVLGHFLQVPSQHTATYFRGLLERYGPLVSLNMAGTPIILIGSMELAKEILEKRASKYSSRPTNPYLTSHVDPTASYWAFHGQGDTNRIGRKLTAGIMSSVRAGLTEPLQEFEALWCIQNLLDDNGKKWGEHLSRNSTSGVLAAGFGMHCPSGNEPELKEAEACATELLKLCSPSASIINVFPFLDYFPGPMPWRIRAREYRRREDVLYSKLIYAAVSGKASGMNTWAAAFSDADGPNGAQSRLVIQLATGAIETTSITLHMFVLACLCYPEWVRNAQKELDEVVGHNRLPTFADRPLLPYTEAVIRETIRWRPAGRFGVPRRSTADDVVQWAGESYFIPKGSTIFPVTWAIEHERGKYNDPDKFDPQRFLNDQGQLRTDYETSAFGFGRRLCPGIPFAERTLWITAAIILWAFNIRKAHDPKSGRAFAYDASDAAFHGHLTNAPREFPAIFEPRSREHEDVARQAWEACEKDLNVLLPAAKND